MTLWVDSLETGRMMTVLDNSGKKRDGCQLSRQLFRVAEEAVQPGGLEAAATHCRWPCSQ